MVPKEKRRRRKRKVFFYLLVFFLVLYFSMTFSKSFLALRKVREELQFTQERVEEMREKNRELEREIQLLHTPAYVERLAREQLGLVREGEVSIIIIKDK